ncbi:MAG: class I SAM-dependent methyltransferase [Caulobacteraceae bacterium]|nr:class I SAM-dependent methyltransferase [Caulobacteraceae bacterium]
MAEADIKAKNDEFKVYAVTMVRNEADIISAFIRQADCLFDKLIVADVQSTDGTGEMLAEAVRGGSRIDVYTVDKQEKFQSAIMNRLARIAFREGADWIFLIDGDEFLNVESRSELIQRLKTFPDTIMHLRWLNLIPSQYGSFSHFDISHPFFWTGRVSSYSKVAISNLFAANNRDFYIHEGNHLVSPTFSETPICPGLPDGLTLLHLPIRSVDRFKYKISVAHRTLLTKHNRRESEGVHVDSMNEWLQSRASLSAPELDSLAANYGEKEPYVREGEEWPTIEAPAYLRAGEASGSEAASMSETLSRDQAVVWNDDRFTSGSLVGAVVEGKNIRIVPQVLTGAGRIIQAPLAALPFDDPDRLPKIDAALVAEAVTAAFTRVRVLTFSAWSGLVPALFCLFTVLRPRRFVELGSHHGMSYFAACQAGDHLGTECIAVDNWLGDPHASFYSDDVFLGFTKLLGSNFPDQMYIRSNFRQALSCFEDKSIDILHIDGYHTYSAVKEDFDTWLPKLSCDGVILFHDINVHEREFGVWRFWQELKERYPAFELMHSHGLGVVYVGEKQSVIADVLSMLSSGAGYGKIAQTFLESVGGLSIEHRTLLQNGADPGGDGKNIITGVVEQGARAEAARGDAESRLLVQALYDARRKPLKTWVRHVKWTANRSLMKLPLPERMRRQARRRTEKYAPDSAM